MEFFDYKRACQELKGLGILPDEQGESVRFTLGQHDDGDSAAIVIGDTSLIADPPAGADHTPGEREQIPQLAEDLIHMLHLDEVFIIPVKQWGGVVNLVAFDLAEDESWLSIDAEAAIHQNSHNPLQIGPHDMGLIPSLCRALMEHGENDEADLTIVATGAPLIIEFRHQGALLVHCGHAGMRDTLLGSLAS